MSTPLAQLRRATCAVTGITLLLCSLAFAAAGPACSDSPGVVRYVLTELPGLGGHSNVRAVWSDPNTGDTYAAGTSIPPEAPMRAVLWHNDQIQVLDSLNGPSEATAVRVENGQPIVAGYSRALGVSPDRAVFWDANGMTELPAAERTVSRAYGMDAAGTVVGQTWTGSGEHRAGLWSAGQLTDLETDPRYMTLAMAVEGADVVGYRQNAVQGPALAALWHSGTRSDLGTLGGAESWAYGLATVSGTLQVVGESNPPLTSATRAFVWQNGTMTNLGTLGGSESGATAINSEGQIVGWSRDQTAKLQATLWEGNQRIDLNRRVLNGSGIQLYRATAIDANGVIAVLGTEPASGQVGHAYLLRPVVLPDAPPLISSVTPASAAQGRTLDVTVNGTGLTPTTQLDFGPGITVNHVSPAAAPSGQPGGATLALVANLTLAGDAPLGAHSLKVTNPDLQWDLAPGAFTVLQGPPALQSFLLSPNTSIQGGLKLWGTVTLSLPAPAPNGGKVKFTSSNRKFKAPQTLLIPRGSSSNRRPFVYKTKKVRQTTTYTLTATYGGVSRSVEVTLHP